MLTDLCSQKQDRLIWKEHPFLWVVLQALDCWLPPILRQSKRILQNGKVIICNSINACWASPQQSQTPEKEQQCSKGKALVLLGSWCQFIKLQMKRFVDRSQVVSQRWGSSNDYISFPLVGKLKAMKIVTNECEWKVDLQHMTFSFFETC